MANQEAELIIYREKNINQLLRDVEKTPLPKYLKVKIDHYLDRFPFLDLTESSVIESIKTNVVVASFFIKEPKKQNVAENNQLVELEKRFKDIKKLKTQGKSAYYLTTDGLVTNLVKRPLIDSTKSIDAQCGKAFFYLKTINGVGGFQDSQYDDAKQFLTLAKHVVSHKFYLVIDGTYFTQSKKEELSTLITTNTECISCFRN